MGGIRGEGINGTKEGLMKEKISYKEEMTNHKTIWVLNLHSMPSVG